MGQTTRRDIPFPDDTDEIADGNEAIQTVAEAVDDDVEYQEGVVGSRPTSTSGSPGVAGRIYRSKPTSNPGLAQIDTGTGWENISGPAYVTSLPSNPIDGQEVYFDRDPSSARDKWHLRYDSSKSGSYKWEVLGAKPIYSHAQDSTQVTSSSATYATGVTPLGVTAPLAGIYVVRHGAQIIYSSPGSDYGYQSFQVGAGTASDDDAVQSTLSTWVSQATERQATVSAAATTVNTVLRVGNNAHTATYQKRWIAIMPLWVG